MDIILKSEAKAGDYPAFIALNAQRFGSGIHFERLWIEEDITANTYPATLGDKPIKVKVPGVKHGLYYDNNLEVE